MKRFSIIILVFLLLFSLNITCFAFQPSEHFHCKIITQNIPDNTAYIDMLIPIEISDENYIDYNTENGIKFNINKNSTIVKYCKNGFASYTFHYQNANSDIKPKYIVNFSCEDSVVEENKILFDKIKEYNIANFNNYNIIINLDDTELENTVDSVLNLLDKDLNYYKKTTYVNFFDYQSGTNAFEEFKNKYKKVKFAYLSSDGEILGITNEQNINNKFFSILIGSPYLDLIISGNTFSVSRTYGPPIGLAVYITVGVIIALPILAIIIIVVYKRKAYRTKFDKLLEP